MSLEPRPGTGPPSLRSGALTSNSPAASLSRQSEKNLPLHVGGQGSSVGLDLNKGSGREELRTEQWETQPLGPSSSPGDPPGPQD